MAAGKHGSSEFTISYDDTPGGTLRDMTNYITEFGGVKISSNMVQSTAFGDTWEEMLPAGLKKMEPITVKGFFDDTASTGPHVVFGDPDDSPQDSTRTLTVVVGNSKQVTVETRLVSYAVMGKVGALTEFEASIQPTGAATWS